MGPKKDGGRDVTGQRVQDGAVKPNQHNIMFFRDGTGRDGKIQWVCFLRPDGNVTSSFPWRIGTVK